MFHGKVDTRTYIASGDLSGLYLHAVDLIANANFKCGVAAAGGGVGVLINKPKHGEHATVAIEGEQEVRVGLAVQAGQYAISAASGWVINCASTTNNNVLGRFTTGAASGMLAVVDLDVVKGPTA